MVLSAACARPSGPARTPRPLPAEPVAAQLRVPPAPAGGQISGVVDKREGGAVMLDSGGPRPVPLRIEPGTKVTLDGQPARGTDVREGDLVRAAYSLDANGEPLALQVVANSRPPPTPRVARQAPQGPTPWISSAGAAPPRQAGPRK